jgi:hypothetical protein
MPLELPSSTTAGAWLLRGIGASFVWPLFISLFSSDGASALAILAGIVLLFVAASLAGKGAAAENDLRGRSFARGSRYPYKLLAASGTGLAAFLFSFGGTGDNVVLGLLFGGLAFLGARLLFGADPKPDRDALETAAAQAGVSADRVVTALDEAHAKIAEIAQQASRIHSVELKSRLARICEGARAILRELERNPKDLSRARRFLVTYLDGTRDVVTKYATQQHDLENTPLADNIRRVLDTVERVIGEQIEVLKRDDRLDLEVKIDVLETQLKNEGVH